ncbi:MAG: cytochrome [Gammaproteobacteria bacterium]|nr:MAG: cytochrome [Gammaproteobacteria bacterium]
MSLDFSPYDTDVQEDPYPIYKQLRAVPGIYYNERREYWVASRYADVKKIAQDPKRFSSASGILINLDPETGKANKNFKPATPSLIMMDPPQHKGLRNLVQRAFTSTRIKLLEPRIRTIASELIDDFIETGEWDFVKDFSGVFPCTVICEMLGCDIKHRGIFKRVADDMVQSVGIKSQSEIAAKRMELFQIINDEIQDRKVNPRDDLISVLVQSDVEGRALTDPELYSFIFTLLLAGTETTTNLLGSALVLMEENPEIGQLLRDDPSEIPNAVEEFLRMESPAQGLARTTTEAVEINGVTIPKGERILLLWGSANKDEDKFSNAELFDVSRKLRDHIAFGFGVHFCLGANLARLEARVALEELVKRIPDYKIHRGNAKRVHAGAIRGWANLPMTFTPGKRQGTPV